MKRFLMLLGAVVLFVTAEGQNRSTSSGISRKTAVEQKAPVQPGAASVRQASNSGKDDADLEWVRVVYRSLDLEKTANAPLYYPVDPVDGQDNLFRIIVSHLADNSLPAYEFLDGREVFSDKYRMSPRDIFDNFQIAYSEGKGSTDRNPKLVVDENDVPSNELLSYYVIERWSFSRRDNKVQTQVEALCPVLHRMDEYGMGTSKYPLCWIRYADLQPYLTSGSIIMSDDNNMPTGSYDDYFRLGKYDGEIYKTQNLRNRMLAELYPDPDQLKHARDSIQERLDSFDKKLWVPSLEELQKRNAVASADSAGVSVPKEKTVVSRSSARRRSGAASKAKPKAAPKAKSSVSRSSSATRSVRDRKR